MTAALAEALNGWERGALYAYHDSTDRTPFENDPDAVRIAELRARFLGKR